MDELILNNIIHKESEMHNLQPDYPNQLAEIMFTSGLTGEPKGVMISHQNLIVNTSSIIKYLRLSEKDTMPVVLPFQYCYGF